MNCKCHKIFYLIGSFLLTSINIGLIIGLYITITQKSEIICFNLDFTTYTCTSKSVMIVLICFVIALFLGLLILWLTGPLYKKSFKGINNQEHIEIHNIESDVAA